MDELAWLNKYPNASEKLRQLIDVVMTNTDVDLTLLSKQRAVDELGQQIEGLFKELYQWLQWGREARHIGINVRDVLDNALALTKVNPQDLQGFDNSLNAFDSAIAMVHNINPQDCQKIKVYKQSLRTLMKSRALLISQIKTMVENQSLKNYLL